MNPFTIPELKLLEQAMLKQIQTFRLEDISDWNSALLKQSQELRNKIIQLILKGQ